MCEIKFRAFDEKNKRMVYSCEFGHLGYGNTQEGRCHKLSQFFRCFSENIQQFTGLLDKNKREIYEGDIVENRNPDFIWNLSEITWDGYGWAVTNLKQSFVPIPLADDWNKPPHKNNMIFANLEIVGNIYQTPELLESK